ncbi:isoprenylcysteine carboxylmethyltransferase family protein [Burkholderia sp. PU8-34]
MNSTLEGVAISQDRPPRSATPFRAGLLGITAGLFALWITRDQPALDGAMRAVIASLSIIGTIALHEIFISRVYLRPSAGLSRQAVRPLSVARVAVRLGALASIYAGIGMLYWLLPEYHGTFYLPFWSLLRSLAPYVIGAAPVYFAWMDRHQRETDDAYLLWGRFLFRGEMPASWQPVRELLAGWMVKAFFLPLMTVYLSKDADHLSASLANAMHAPMSLALFVFMYDLSFTMDLMFGTVGYLCTFRILDSHVRTAEPTTLGWVAALICYQPFWSLISTNYIHYEGSMFWDNWLLSAPAIRVVWGATIIALLLCYALSTIAFGLRFSNLTNRGIITSGPYRFTKHPAYITKNLSYWMVSVPFVEPLGWQVALAHSAALATVNLIYYLRAKTEERHLMRDPDYRAYAAWIAEHGLFARIRRVFGQQQAA